MITAHHSSKGFPDGTTFVASGPTRKPLSDGQTYDIGVLRAADGTTICDSAALTCYANGNRSFAWTTEDGVDDDKVSRIDHDTEATA